MSLRLLAILVAAFLALAPTAALAEENGEASPEEAVATFAEVLDLIVQRLADLVDDEVRAAINQFLVDALNEVQFAVLVASVESDVELQGEVDANHGEIVSTVARCAPRGRSVGEIFTGMRNHGSFVTAAAHGNTVVVDVPTIEEVDGEPVVTGSEAVGYDLSTLEGAEGLCEAVATIQLAADLEAATRDGDDEQRGNRPEHAGPPEHANRPDHAGKPDHAGTENTGRPDHAGKPDHDGQATLPQSGPRDR